MFSQKPQSKRTTMVVALVALCSSGCAQAIQPTLPPGSGVRLANPASVNCVNAGGRLIIEQRPDGGQFGVCLFADDRQCEEWAMLRGECPIGGAKISGYATPDARYCILTGGHYTESGTCTFSTGKTCAATLYFAGQCDKAR